MKKRTVAFIIAAVIVAAGITVYFLPLHFSNVVNEKYQLKIMLAEFGTKEDDPTYIDSTVYEDITSEQKSEILTLLGDYSYNRTLNTLFSDGSLSGLRRCFTIYMYDGDSYLGDITVASSDRVRVNGKTYSMNNTEQFMDQAIEILQ